MGIEIRPNEVSSQIATKSVQIDTAKTEIGVWKQNIYEFIDQGSLDGEGYAAAKYRLSCYPKLLSGIEEVINLTAQADQDVSNALGSFEGAEVVSEDEWLEKKEEALSNAADARDEMYGYINELRRLESGDGSYVRGLAEAAALESFNFDMQAEEAGEWLSKIYSYVEETNNIHTGVLEEIETAIAAGVNAFRDTVSPETWFNTDMTWFENLKVAAAKHRPNVNGLDDLYSDGTVNKESCEILFNTPFELLSEEEINALTDAYNTMWILRDTEGIEEFLKCAYIETGNIYSYSYGEGKDLMWFESNELALTATFNQFVKYYVENEGGELSDSQHVLFSNFLSDITDYMSSIYVKNKGDNLPLKIGYLSNSSVNRGNDGLFCLTFECESIEGTPPGIFDNGWPLRTLVSGGSDPGAFLNDLLYTDYRSLQKSVEGEVGMTAALSTIEYLAGDLIGPLAIIIDMIGAGKEANKENDFISNIQSKSAALYLVDEPWFTGTASLVDGAAVFRDIECDQDLLSQAIAYYHEGSTKNANNYLGEAEQMIPKIVNNKGVITPEDDSDIYVFLTTTIPMSVYRF